MAARVSTDLMLYLFVIYPAKGIEMINPIGKQANNIPSCALFKEKRSCNPGIREVKVDKINPDRKKNTDTVMRLKIICCLSSGVDPNKTFFRSKK
jgi:hypothetical protein